MSLVRIYPGRASLLCQHSQIIMIWMDINAGLIFVIVLSTGNAAIGLNENDTFLSDYRSGILLHTGEWEHWNSSEPMPNR